MIDHKPTPRPKTKASAAVGPYVPPQYTMADVTALQALQRGEADSAQQQRALNYLIIQASATYEFLYYQTERDTAFALGRAFVGQQIVKLLKIDPTILRRTENVDA